MLPARPGSHARDAVSLVVEEYQEVNRVKRLLFTAILECMSDSRSLRQRRLNVRPYRIIERVPAQVAHLTRLVGLTDVDCINNLRMDRNTFGRLCILLRERTGLIDGRWVKVEEQVAMFLCVLAHHSKNRIVGFNFRRSLQTISHYIHSILSSILQLHGDLLATPEPVNDGCTDPRWKCFPGCLGALDGTYINVTVSNGDKARYRTRKGQISTNVLAVCDRKLRFVYVLSGWEGSAGDSRILRDAINRPNGLKVPKGSYYLCDNGYSNSVGFLTPYKGVRYHLKEWGPNAIRPQNPSKYKFPPGLIKTRKRNRQIFFILSTINKRNSRH